MNKILRRVPAFLRNKYFLSLAVFCVIMLFLDKNDFLTQLDRHRELRKSQQSRAYYTKALVAERKVLQSLETSPAAVEKVARENYLMKRDNEELFLIPENYDAKGTEAKN